MAKRGRRKTSRTWIQHGPLAPWMLLYARWLVGHPSAELARMPTEGIRVRGSYKPTSADRVAAASRFATRNVDKERVVQLERRDDFRQYFENLRSDAHFLAKELVREDIVSNVEARREGLKRALDTQDDGKAGKNVDHKAVETYTRWTRDIAFPKKPEKDVAQPRVVINLIGASEEQKRLVLSALSDEPAEEIEYEIIPNEKLLGDGSDE